MPVRTDFKPGEFCWVDLNAHDMQAAIAWYSTLFGWTAATMDTPGGGPPYAFLMSGANGVGGVGESSEEMKAAGVPPMWNSYISTDDCEATEARARELGATITVPTMTIPGHGKLAYFLDPEGASIAVWQSLATDGPGMLVGELGGFCWNELMTRDVGKASEFYGALTDWTFSQMPMGDFDYTVANVGDTQVGGFLPMVGELFEGVPAHWLVYFAVGDCDEVVARATATGATVRVPPMDIPVGRMAILADPQGAGFAVIQLADANS